MVDIHVNMKNAIYKYIHEYVSMYTYTYIHAYMHAYIHAYIHTNIHTYTCIHMVLQPYLADNALPRLLQALEEICSVEFQSGVHGWC